MSRFRPSDYHAVTPKGIAAKLTGAGWTPVDDFTWKTPTNNVHCWEVALLLHKDGQDCLPYIKAGQPMVIAPKPRKTDAWPRVSRPKRYKTPRPAVTSERIIEVRKMKDEDGMSFREIAAHLGMVHASVARIYTLEVDRVDRRVKNGQYSTQSP